MMKYIVLSGVIIFSFLLVFVLDSSTSAANITIIFACLFPYKLWTLTLDTLDISIFTPTEQQRQTLETTWFATWNELRFGKAKGKYAFRSLYFKMLKEENGHMSFPRQKAEEKPLHVHV